MVVKAIGQLIDHALLIEKEILNGEKWIVPGVVSFLEAKYKPIIDESLQGCFNLLR